MARLSLASSRMLSVHLGAGMALFALPLVVAVDRLLNAPWLFSVIDVLFLLCIALADAHLALASIAFAGLWLVTMLLGGVGWTWAQELAVLLPAQAGLAERPKLRLVLTGVFATLLARPWTASNVTVGVARTVVVVAVFIVAWVLVDLFVRRQHRLEAAEQALRDQRLAIARELHDSVAYELSLTSIRVQQAQLEDDPAAERIDFVVEDIAKAIRDLGSLMDWLREDFSGVRDLVVGADEVVSRFARRITDGGFAGALTAPDAWPRLSPSTEWVLAGVLRELANNVLRHGDPARPVSIEAGDADGRLLLMVVNGAGAGGPGRTDGRPPMGLDGMHERAQLVGGVVVSTPDDDVWVTSITLPTVEANDRR